MFDFVDFCPLTVVSCTANDNGLSLPMILRTYSVPGVTLSSGPLHLPHLVNNTESRAETNILSVYLRRFHLSIFQIWRPVLPYASLDANGRQLFNVLWANNIRSALAFSVIPLLAFLY